MELAAVLTPAPKVVTLPLIPILEPQPKAKLWKRPWTTCAKPLSYIWKSFRLILKSADKTLDNIYSNSQKRIDNTQLLYF